MQSDSYRVSFTTSLVNNFDPTPAVFCLDLPTPQKWILLILDFERQHSKCGTSASVRDEPGAPVLRVANRSQIRRLQASGVDRSSNGIFLAWSIKGLLGMRQWTFCIRAGCSMEQLAIRLVSRLVAS
jgi:hypothetical protein